jgi:ribosomal-protein-alanine N-acetyltransferase
VDSCAHIRFVRNEFLCGHSLTATINHVFTMRDYRPGDFDSLWKLDQLCFREGISYSKAELRHYIDRPASFTVVAEEAGKVAGFLVADRSRRGYGHIITIDVHPSKRRTGIGAALMQQAEERLRISGCDSVFLETAVDNVSALGFYKSLGYSVLKTIPRYYLNSIDALQMGKRLARAESNAQG